MVVASSYAAGRFALTVADETAGFVKSFSGGNLKAEVATHDLGPDSVTRKHASNIKYEDISVEVGMGMSKEFYDWIQASLDSEFLIKNGEITAADFNYKARHTLEFDKAHIASIGFPGLDASSKDPAYMSIKFAPETVRYKEAGGEIIGGIVDPKAKRWLSSAFRFRLGGLPCTTASKIGAIEIKQNVLEDQVGAFREARKFAAKLEVPNIKVTMSMRDFQPWQTWAHQSLVQGDSAGAEVSGSIEFLAHDHKTVLGELTLLEVGVVSVSFSNLEANKDEIAQFEAELYVERMKFKYYP